MLSVVMLNVVAPLQHPTFNRAGARNVKHYKFVLQITGLTGIPSRVGS
jgi:hypothetical protein